MRHTGQLLPLLKFIRLRGQICLTAVPDLSWPLARTHLDQDSVQTFQHQHQEHLLLLYYSQAKSRVIQKSMSPNQEHLDVFEQEPRLSEAELRLPRAECIPRRVRVVNRGARLGRRSRRFIVRE